MQLEAANPESEPAIEQFAVRCPAAPSGVWSDFCTTGLPPVLITDACEHILPQHPPPCLGCQNDVRPQNPTPVEVITSVSEGVGVPLDPKGFARDVRLQNPEDSTPSVSEGVEAEVCGTDVRIPPPHAVANGVEAEVCVTDVRPQPHAVANGVDVHPVEGVDVHPVEGVDVHPVEGDHGGVSMWLSKVKESIFHSNRTDTASIVSKMTVLAHVATKEVKQNKLRKGIMSDVLASLPMHTKLKFYNSPFERRLRGFCTHLFVVLNLIFIGIGIYALTRPEPYQVIIREDKLFSACAQLPMVAINPDPVLFDTRIHHVISSEGRTIKRTPVNVTQCVVQIGTSASQLKLRRYNYSCLPRLEVCGQEGDAHVEHVEIDRFLLPGYEVARASGKLNLVIEDRPTYDSPPFNFAHYYTYLISHWTGIDVFFRKILVHRPDRVGAAEVLGEASEPLWYNETYLRYHWQITSERPLQPAPPDLPEGTKKISTVYLRAGLTETEESYEPYNFMRMLGQAGAVWTSSGFVFAVMTLAITYSRRKCVSLFRR
eukprot:TRINITY_DN11133_c0_g1_i2.p1 TRINITY_DN11133_c0_g1~~TRINITY_DN11133_c0_g1_i2.p1  ORF type:complete len:542 (+),score=30.12 TRINITY_DN11133_c0_g1_i2:130-1755(+)